MIVWSWLDVIEKRLNAATTGKWHIGHISEIKRDAMNIDSEDGPICDDVYGEANIAFILNSKEDIGRLINAVKVLKNALEFHNCQHDKVCEGTVFIGAVRTTKEALEQTGRME